MSYTPGTQLRSVIDETELVVVRPAAGDVELRCGGAPMVEKSEPVETRGEPAADFSDGTALGKRYVDNGSGLEVMVTKPGRGTLQAGDSPLTLKSAKPLPSSD